MWRVPFAGLLALAACSATAGDPAGREEAPAPVDGGSLFADGGSADAAPVEVTLSQSTSEEITPQNSVACVQQDADGNPIEHRENSFYRVFPLGTMGVSGRLETSSVAVAIQSADSPASPQPMSVLLHTLTGSDLTLANLTQLARADITVPNQGAGVIDVPLVASAPAGTQLVVEIFLPDSAGAGNLIFPGSNAETQTGPSYIRAPVSGCALTEPTDIADIGFPDMHLVVSVTGTAY